jgi:hypothetical protein
MAAAIALRRSELGEGQSRAEDAIHVEERKAITGFTAGDENAMTCFPEQD